MHIKLVLQILGILLLFLGLSLLLPIPWALYYGEADWMYFLQAALPCFVLGGLSFVTRDKNQDLRPKEGFAVVTFGWITLSAFGALPYFLSGSIPSYTDAFFETISGFTTTGASILTDIESLSYSMLFWRNLTNWIGGMGIIVLTIAILPFLGVGGMQLFKAESPGPIADRLKPRITETAKLLWLVYLAYTIIIIILLMLGGMSFFDSVCHSFSTIATAGHSPKNASIGHYNSTYINFVITFFMLVAAVNFSLHYKLLTGDWRALVKNKEFRFFISVVLIISLIIIGDILFNTTDTILWIIDSTLFQVLAISSTTGLGNSDYELWPMLSQKMIFLVMFMGGMAGSTAGGIKVIRIMIILKFVKVEFQKLLHPNAIINMRIGDQVVERSIILNVMGFLLIFCLIALLGTIAISALGLDFLTSFSAVITTLNNVGPGFGIIGPTDNYALIPDAGKWILSFFMLVGRLEFFTVLVLLTPQFWSK